MTMILRSLQRSKKQGILRIAVANFLMVGALSAFGACTNPKKAETIAGPPSAGVALSKDKKHQPDVDAAQELLQPPPISTVAPEEMSKSSLRALPLEPSPDQRRVILAYVEATSTKPFERSCLGSSLGDPGLPNCNFANDPELLGFFNSVEHARAKIDLLLSYAPDLHKQAALEMIITAHGRSDGHRYQAIGPDARSMLARYDELSRVYGLRLPPTATPEEKLAYVRALEILESLGPGFKKTIGDLETWDGNRRFKMDVIGTVFSQKGAEFRGATVSAVMRIVVEDQAHEAIIVATLQEAGLKTSVARGGT